MTAFGVFFAVLIAAMFCGFFWRIMRALLVLFVLAVAFAVWLDSLPAVSP